MSASNLSILGPLAKELIDHPWKAEILANDHPAAFEMVTQAFASPFFRWKPFGDTLNDGNTCQAGFLESLSKNKWGICGNRCGKTESGLFEDVGDCIGLDPVSKGPSRRFNTPIHMWVVSDTEETSVEVIERTIVREVLGEDESGFMWNFVDDKCGYTDKGGWSNKVLQFTNGSRIGFKFSTQKRKTFQGVSLDKVHHDEAQPRDIYSECRTRLADKDGYFLGTFTPIYEKNSGIPWVYEELYIPKKAEFHNWSLLHNPYIPDSAKQALIAEWDEDERDARIHGMFVPIGIKLAIATSTLREMKKGLQEPQTNFVIEGNQVMEAA